MTVLAMIPLMVALYLGYVPSLVAVVQLAFSAGIVLVVALSRPKHA